MSEDTSVHSNQNDFVTFEQVYGLNVSPVLSTADVQSRKNFERNECVYFLLV